MQDKKEISGLHPHLLGSSVPSDATHEMRMHSHTWCSAFTTKIPRENTHLKLMARFICACTKGWIFRCYCWRFIQESKYSGTSKDCPQFLQILPAELINVLNELGFSVSMLLSIFAQRCNILSWSGCRTVHICENFFLRFAAVWVSCRSGVQLCVPIAIGCISKFNIFNTRVIVQEIHCWD